MSQPLDCEAFVIEGMNHQFIDWLHSLEGRRVLSSARIMHQDRRRRLKEVVKTYYMDHLYAGLCRHHQVDNLADLCKVVSAESAKHMRRMIEHRVEESLSQLLWRLTETERRRLARML